MRTGRGAGIGWPVRCLLLASVGLATLPAPAQQAGMRTQPALERADIERDYLRQAFPSPHSPFSFSILIPRDWLWFEKEGRPAAPNGKLQLLIAYGDRTDESLVEISALEIEREMAPADWLQQWLTVNGYEILASRPLPSAHGRNADVKARRQIGDRSVIFRIRTYKNGNYIYLLHCFSDEARYSQVEDAFLVAAESFRLTEAPAQAYAEPMRDIPLDRLFQAGFKMPASWTATPDQGTTPDSQSWTLTNRRGTDAIGLVHVHTAPLSRFKDAAAALEMSGRWLRENDVDFPGAELTPVDSGMPGVWIGVNEQKVRIGGHPGLVKQTIMRTGKGWALFTLATKAMEPDLYMVTAINRRGFDIAFGSFLTALMSQ